MILKGIDFGNVIAASGALNFFGDGYWFHEWLRRFRLLDHSGITFVAKTSTLYPREGNMPLWPGTTIPKELKPACIIVNPLKGIVLNAVGLSGPGILALLQTGRWQKQTDPFFISFMSVDPDPKLHAFEFEQCINLLGPYLKDFQASIGLKINFSCPNVGMELQSGDELREKVCEFLTIGSQLGIPLIPKFNAMLPPKTALAIAEHDACSAICVSNAIPFGALPEQIDWKYLFGSGPSPLAYIDSNGGALSGKPLFPIVVNWVRTAQSLGISKPVIAGGGILSVRDADTMIKSGAAAISLGSVFILRPWQVQSIIRYANETYS
ncbi:MAG: hypothetical protein V1719_01090 [Patescibacteria group bacterium]